MEKRSGELERPDESGPGSVRRVGDGSFQTRRLTLVPERRLKVGKQQKVVFLGEPEG